MFAAAATVLMAGGPARGMVGSSASSVVVSVSPAAVRVSLNEALLGTNQPVAGAGPVIAPLGIDWARADMSLDGSYDCAHHSWDPSSLDRTVSEDLAMGGEPELIVDYSPPCMTSNPLHETLDPPDAAGYVPWQALVEQAAYHAMTAFGVHVFEVWNEPDGTFWHGTIPDYLAMYRATSEAIASAAQRAGVKAVLVGGPALLFSDPVWLEAFLSYVDANHLPLGFVSWHYYGDYPALGPFATSAGVLPPQVGAAGPYWYNPLTRAQTFGLQVSQMKAEIAKYPDLHPLTVIDEWNIDAGYDARSDGAYDAAFAEAVLDSVQQSGLDRMAFFRVADDKPATLGNWGMLYSDLTPKPVYRAFEFWHELAGTILQVTETPPQDASDPTGRIGAVASTEGPEALNVVIYDFAPYDPTGSYGTNVPNRYDHPVTLALGDVLRSGRWKYTVRMIDASSEGQVVSRGSLTGQDRSLPVQMHDESVALVQLRRAG